MNNRKINPLRNRIKYTVAQEARIADPCTAVAQIPVPDHNEAAHKYPGRKFRKSRLFSPAHILKQAQCAAQLRRSRKKTEVYYSFLTLRT